MAITHATFEARHPEYDPEYWERCRALYLGGKQLLDNDRVMSHVMPRHPAEPEGQYKIRRKMASYENVAAPPIDFVRAGLSQDPLRVEVEDGTGDAFYEDFAEDTGPAGGRVCKLSELVKALAQSVMLYRRGWLRADLPRNDGKTYPSLAAQDAEGARRAYVVPLDPEHVIDWEDTDDGTGQLAWALTMEVSSKRRGLLGDRNLCTERYTLYTAESSQVFEFDYDKLKQPDGPKASEPPTRVFPAVSHTFKAVPLLRMEAPESSRGLFAMAMIEPLARRHVDATNALDYAEARVLFCPRTVFLDPGSALDAAEEADPQAVVSQPQGTSTVITMRGGVGTGDKVEYPSPPTEVFTHALAAKKERVEGINRVMHLMRLAVEQTASAVGRSGESKKADRADSTVVLGAFGDMIRTFFEAEVYPLLAVGRGDEGLSFKASGLAKFDEGGFAETLEACVQWALQPFQSPTMNTKMGLRLYDALDPDGPDDEREKVRGELESSAAVDHEAVQAEAGARGAIADETAKQAGEIVKPKPAAKPPGKAKK